MRGHIVKVTTGGRSLEEYLKGCNQAGQGFEAYLGEHSDGLRFHRYADGTECPSKRLRDGGLEMLLDGRDPDSGELLKSFRAGNVRAYEIPLNDSKDLDVASVVYGDVREARMKAQARGEEAVRRFLSERLTVRLRCGDGRRRWVRPDEVMFVSATHFTSRAGDPELHRHLELINRVRVGDEWYSIDSSRLFGMYENIRSVYETTVYGDAGLCDAMAAHGMTLDMQGRVPELGNASDVFSKRRDAINARMAELVDEWRAAHADGMRRVRDPETGEVTTEEYEYAVEVPYEYYILNVKLTSKPISSVASELLTPEQLEMYQVYRQTLGNKPLIFGGGSPDTSNSEDLTGVVFVNGTRPGNQAVVDIAKSQVGNVGGQPYWSWYGFNSRVEWCACFVSWCYGQMGLSEPRFAACQSQGIPWFQSHGQWGGRDYANIAPGDAIFFDWDLDGSADHVGLVVGTDGSRVYTVEGNSGDACKIKSYSLSYECIKGYGLMNW